jgi:hypothetical protein
VKLAVATEADFADRKDKPPFADFIQTTLEDVTKKAGVPGKAWVLKVTIPANAWSGPIPRDTAVYLKIEGEKPRFIRIPVIGNAYIK